MKNKRNQIKEEFSLEDNYFCIMGIFVLSIIGISIVFFIGLILKLFGLNYSLSTFGLIYSAYMLLVIVSTILHRKKRYKRWLSNRIDHLHLSKNNISESYNFNKSIIPLFIHVYKYEKNTCENINDSYGIKISLLNELYGSNKIPPKLNGKASFVLEKFKKYINLKEDEQKYSIPYLFSSYNGFQDKMDQITNQIDENIYELRKLN